MTPSEYEREAIRFSRKRQDGELSDMTVFMLICLLVFIVLCTLTICWSHGEEAKRLNGGCLPVVERMDNCDC